MEAETRNEMRETRTQKRKGREPSVETTNEIRRCEMKGGKREKRREGRGPNDEEGGREMKPEDAKCKARNAK